MESMKISIIYFSETKNTEAVAKNIAAGIESVPETEVKLFNIKNEESLDIDFINGSKAVVFGTPTYVGNLCWQLKKWFDTSWNVNLCGRLGGVFATENSPNGGGAELAIMTVVSQMLVRGMLVYSSGREYGKPTIHLGPAVLSTNIEEKEQLCRVFGTRIAKKAHELFNE